MSPRLLVALLLAFLLVLPFTVAQEPSDTSDDAVPVCVTTMRNISHRPIGRRLQRDRLMEELEKKNQRAKSGEFTVRPIALESELPQEARQEGGKRCTWYLHTELVDLRTTGDREPGNRPGEKAGDPLAQHPAPPRGMDTVHRAVIRIWMFKSPETKHRYVTTMTVQEHMNENDTVSSLLTRVANLAYSQIKKEQPANP